MGCLFVYSDKTVLRISLVQRDLPKILSSVHGSDNSNFVPCVISGLGGAKMVQCQSAGPSRPERGGNPNTIIKKYLTVHIKTL